MRDDRDPAIAFARQELENACWHDGYRLLCPSVCLLQATDSCSLSLHHVPRQMLLALD
jgi:hypothetical protein